MSRAPREVVRPEERAGGDADKYYDRGVTEAYTELNVRTQSELTTRCLDMLCLEDDAREEVLLDIGCGSGLSGETLTRHGYRAWVGIDASAAMLERATRGRSAPKRTADEKERRGNIEDPPAPGVQAGTSRRSAFGAGAFDGCVSHPPRSGSARGPSRKTRRGTRTTRPCAISGFRYAVKRARYASGVPEDGPRDRGVRGGDSTRGTPDGSPSSRSARKQKQKAVRVRAARRRRRTRAPVGKANGNPLAAAVSPGVAARGDVRSRVARLRDKRGRGNRTLDTRDEARDARSVRSRARRGAAARAAVAAARAGRGVRVARENAGTRGADVSVLVSGCWRRSTPRVPAARSPRRSTRRRHARRERVSVRVVGVVARARVRPPPGAAPKSERTDGERTDRANPRTSSRLEHSLRLTALGSPRRVETTSSHVRLECFSRSVAFQEFVLETPFGDFGVFAAEAEARTRRERAVRGEEDSRTDSDSAHQENAGVAVLSRARAALGACLKGAGSVVCASVLSRSSDAEGADGDAPEKEASQAWVLWWPSRDVGGTSAEPGAGFRETSGLGESVRDAFSDASF